MKTAQVTKWARKLHRWLAYPTIILVPLMIVLRMVNSGAEEAVPGIIVMLQSFLMLSLVLSGLILFVGPKLIKRSAAARAARKADAEKE
ncbi:MAG: hypothetical protein JW904_10655 [Spirochaetales bacterium]|nr:hypothetical protein [Spirochaetales bacterium]